MFAKTLPKYGHIHGARGVMTWKYLFWRSPFNSSQGPLPKTYGETAYTFINVEL